MRHSVNIPAKHHGPEIDHAAERRADRIGYAAIKKQFKWSDEDFALARDRYNCPASLGRSIPIAQWAG